MLTLLSDHDSACACDCAMPSGVLAERLARDDRLASAPPAYYFDSHVTAPSSFKQSSLPWPPPSSGRPSLPSPLPSLQVQSIAPNTDFPQYSWSSISLALWICFVAFYGSYSQGRNRRSAGHVSRRLGPLMVLTCRQYRCMRQKRCRQCMLVLLLCSLSSLSAQSVENSSEIEETDQLTTFSDSPVGSVEVTHQPAVGTSSRVLQEDTPDARLQLDYPESNNDLTEASIESLFCYSSKIRQAASTCVAGWSCLICLMLESSCPSDATELPDCRAAAEGQICRGTGSCNTAVAGACAGKVQLYRRGRVLDSISDFMGSKVESLTERPLISVVVLTMEERRSMLHGIFEKIASSDH